MYTYTVTKLEFEYVCCIGMHDAHVHFGTMVRTMVRTNEAQDHEAESHSH